MCCSQPDKSPSLCIILNWKSQQLFSILTHENNSWSYSYMFIFSADIITRIMQINLRKRHVSSSYKYDTFSRPQNSTRKIHRKEFNL